LNAATVRKEPQVPRDPNSAKRLKTERSLDELEPRTSDHIVPDVAIETERRSMPHKLHDPDKGELRAKKVSSGPEFSHEYVDQEPAPRPHTLQIALWRYVASIQVYL
jgi:hypothetical protein